MTIYLDDNPLADDIPRADAVEQRQPADDVPEQHQDHANEQRRGHGRHQQDRPAHVSGRRS